MRALHSAGRHKHSASMCSEGYSKNKELNKRALSYKVQGKIPGTLKRKTANHSSCDVFWTMHISNAAIIETLKESVSVFLTDQLKYLNNENSALCPSSKQIPKYFWDDTFNKISSEHLRCGLISRKQHESSA